MKDTLEDFRVGIKQLLEFLENTEKQRQFFGLLNARSTTLPEQEAELLASLLSASTETRRYIYVVGIVSLYGLLERLVDDLIVAYVDQLVSYAKPYSGLPERIRNNHLPFSLELASLVAKERNRSGTSQETIIANLHTCLSGATDYKLNGAAFAIHRGNRSLSKITDALTAIGVHPHVSRIVNTPTFTNFVQESEPERDLSQVADADHAVLLEPIDDLVDRRNEIAHGIVQIDQIESVDLLKGRSRFVEAYGTALFELLTQESLKYAAECGCARSLGKPIAVYNHCIVCFDSERPVAIGDTVIAVTARPLEPVRHCSVVSIEVDRQARDDIPAGQALRFGVKVSFHANEGYDYYVLPAPDRKAVVQAETNPAELALEALPLVE